MKSCPISSHCTPGRPDPSYTEAIMTEQNALQGRQGCRPEGSTLPQSRRALSEVQICGNPKQRIREVAPTT
jgi:hypothetical protein